MCGRAEVISIKGPVDFFKRTGKTPLIYADFFIMHDFHGSIQMAAGVFWLWLKNKKRFCVLEKYPKWLERMPRMWCMNGNGGGDLLMNGKTHF